MKSLSTYILVSILFIRGVFAQSDSVSIDTSKVVWKNSTARVLAPGRIEMGVVAPLAFGLKHNMEISVHKLLFFVAPNLKLKKNWTKNAENKWQIATEHSFSIPTLLLNMLATDGLIGVYPSNETAPPILTFRNRFIGSYYYKKNHAISFKTGIEVNLLYSQFKDFQEVELLYIYPRTASYSNPFVVDAAIGFAGDLNDKWSYDADLTVFFIPASSENVWVYEFNPKVYLNIKSKFRVAAGVNLTAGNVPHEKQDFRALPFLDFQFPLFHK